MHTTYEDLNAKLLAEGAVPLTKEELAELSPSLQYGWRHPDGRTSLACSNEKAYNNARYNQAESRYEKLMAQSTMANRFISALGGLAKLNGGLQYELKMLQGQKMPSEDVFKHKPDCHHGWLFPDGSMAFAEEYKEGSIAF